MALDVNTNPSMVDASDPLVTPAWVWKKIDATLNSPFSHPGKRHRAQKHLAFGDGR
jgi:hypothetical protein